MTANIASDRDGRGLEIEVGENSEDIGDGIGRSNLISDNDVVGGVIVGGINRGKRIGAIGLTAESRIIAKPLERERLAAGVTAVKVMGTPE